MENNYNLDGYQWTNPHVEVGQAYKSGGQWRHFVPYVNYDDCGCGVCKRCTRIKCYDGYRDDWRRRKAIPIAEEMTKKFGGNINGLQRLKDTVKKREANKVVYIDFEYLLSNGANTDSVTISRQKLYEVTQFWKMLRFYGFRTVVLFSVELDSYFSTEFFRNNNYVEKVVYSKPSEVYSNMMLMNADITKIFYIGSMFHDIGFMNTRRKPIYLTASNSLYINRNLADYVSNSSYHDNAITDITSAILLSFSIDPFTYHNKVTNSVYTNVRSNFDNKIGKNYVVTESSTRYRDIYEPILNNPLTYNIDSEWIGQAYSSVGTIGKPDEKFLDDVYIVTDWQYVIDNFNAFKHNRVFLLSDKMDLTNTATLEILKGLDALEMTNINWSIMTMHFTDDKTDEFYLKMLELKLYNILGIMDITDPIVLSD